MSNVTAINAPAIVATCNFIVVVAPKRGFDAVETVVDAVSVRGAIRLALAMHGPSAEVVARKDGRPSVWRASPGQVWRAERRVASAAWRATVTRVDALLARMADAGVGEAEFYSDALAMIRFGEGQLAALADIGREAAKAPPIEDLAPLPAGLRDRIGREIHPDRVAGALALARARVVRAMGRDKFLEAEGAARRRRIDDARRKARPIFARLAAQAAELDALIEEGTALLGRAVTDRIGAAKAARAAADAAKRIDAAVAARAAAAAAIIAVGEAAKAAEADERAADAARFDDIMREFGLA